MTQHPMTRPPLDLEAIRQRVEAATEPTGGTRWHVESEPYSHHVFSGRDENHRDSVDIATYMHSEADAVFIAHAREDVPALLAEVDRLRSAIKARAEEWRESTATGHPGCDWDQDCVGCAADEVLRDLEATP